LEEVTVCSGHKVLMEVENNILLIVGNLQGILEQQLRPRTIHLLQLIFKFIRCFLKLEDNPALKSPLTQVNS
jgi:hypothetical protein